MQELRQNLTQMLCCRQLSLRSGTAFTALIGNMRALVYTSTLRPIREGHEAVEMTHHGSKGGIAAPPSSTLRADPARCRFAGPTPGKPSVAHRSLVSSRFDKFETKNLLLGITSLVSAAALAQQSGNPTKQKNKPNR